MGLLSRAANCTASIPAIWKDTSTVEGKIFQFHKTHAKFNCIVLEIPVTQEFNISQKLNEMLKHLGIVIPLSNGRPLILFPERIDRELIAHRLSKRLNTSSLLSFETNSPENAINRIKSLS